MTWLVGQLSMLRVAAFTGGKDVPSARYRVRQYIPLLREKGVQLREYSALLGCYPPASRWFRPFWGAATLASRLPGVVASFAYDLTLLQREMVSTFLTTEPYTKRPRALDVDDAIWLHRRGGLARELARRCDGVICGNAFLAENFLRWNPNVHLLPTGVDIERYRPANRADQPDLLIGWCGTSGNLRELYAIEGSLAKALEERSQARLLVISDKHPQFRTVPAERVLFRPWSPDAEVTGIQQMAVGIMPLQESLWARGKCSFKMLTYMACEVPVVVSPVGMNSEVLSLGCCGLPALSDRQWVDALASLLDHPDQRRTMGRTGRQIVEKHYSTRLLAPRFASILKSFVA